MTIDQDLKQALLARDSVRVSALRNLKSDMDNAAIRKGQALDEAETLAVIQRKVKQHQDSIESFQQGGRPDLVAHEAGQMQILQRYLPAALPEAEVQGLVQAVIADLAAGPKDFGKVMKEVLARAQGRTDGSIVSRLVKEQLK